MPKWEYTWLRVHPDPGQTMEVGGETVRIDGFIDRMGKQGWELVSVAPETMAGGVTRWFLYWFKRPKP